MAEARKARPPMGQMALPPHVYGHGAGGCAKHGWHYSGGRCRRPPVAPGGGGGGGVAAQPLRAAEMRPKTSGSVTRDAASEGGDCPAERGAGDGGEPCGAGGTWGESAEEWARSGAGLCLLSVGGGGLAPSPHRILSPLSQPPPGQAGGQAWVASGV